MVIAERITETDGAVWLSAEAAEELARDLLRAVEEATDHDMAYHVQIIDAHGGAQAIEVRPRGCVPRETPADKITEAVAMVSGASQ